MRDQTSDAECDCLVLVYNASHFFLDPAMRNDDQYFIITSEIIKVICVTPSVFLASKIFSDIRFADLGVKVNRQAFKDFLAGFAIVAFIFILEFVIFRGLGWLAVENVAWHTEALGNIVLYSLVMLFTFILVGWSEELLSRGFLLNATTSLTRKRHMIADIWKR